VFLLNEPKREAIEHFLEIQQNAQFSYPDVGMTRDTVDLVRKDYNVDHNRILIGRGPDNFQAAVTAVKNWKMFNIPWINLCWPDTPIEIGSTVAILVRHFGFWSLNAARIVYVIEETGGIEKFGFAYGTLQEHSEKGEERFSVEFSHISNEVWYDLFAISTPNHLLARLGYPLSRMLQRRFVEDSKNAMVRAVKNGAA
jgi:uncharacterized protein (UPF0548 family)